MLEASTGKQKHPCHIRTKKEVKEAQQLGDILHCRAGRQKPFVQPNSLALTNCCPMMLPAQNSSQAHCR